MYSTSIEDEFNHSQSTLLKLQSSNAIRTQIQLTEIIENDEKLLNNEEDENDNDDDDDDEEDEKKEKEEEQFNNEIDNLGIELKIIDNNYDDEKNLNTTITTSTISTSTTGLSARRQIAKQLPPLNSKVANNHSGGGGGGGDDRCDGRGAMSSIPSSAGLRIPKSNKSINIAFSDLSYTVKTGLWRRESKTIINGLSGEFKSGELTAIMGPSGAGKSTLLDILSGYTTEKVNGEITVNGRERVLRRFRRQSVYIMQDHGLQPYITVLEAMHFAANLKVGREMSQMEKKTRIKQILEAIGLYECRKIRTGMLSGGQKKRLAIALEIFDNPPVMFFDEPTSGLDSSTSTQVVYLLKELAREGRTIISTIHQPSAIVFGMFDHLYAIAEGQCIFTGATNSLIPFLKDLNLICPESYNPTDYLLEISTHDYGFINDKLIKKTENGKETRFRKKQNQQPTTAQVYSIERAEKLTASGLITPVKAPVLSHRSFSIISESSPAELKVLTFLKSKKQQQNNHEQQHPSSSSTTSSSTGTETTTATTIKKQEKSPKLSKKSPKKQISLQIPDTTECCQRNETYATSFYRQLALLLMRSFLILWRDRSLTIMRFFIHFSIAALVGVLYIGIGNDAANVINNFNYIFFTIMFLMFTSFSAMTLSFPSELPIVTREHFNRWYSLKAYFTAMTLADAPIQTLCMFIYIFITYLMTSQPLEFFRASLFFGMCFMCGLVASSIGLCVGALFDVKNGAVFGPFFICPFLIFSGFFIHLKDAHPMMHWLFHVSFLKYALEGSTLAIFGYDRPKMNCDELFCQFVLPKKFMQFIDMNNGDYLTATIALFLMFLLFRWIAFYVMAFRLRSKQ